MAEANLAKLRKRRRVARASITRLTSRIGELETSSSPDAEAMARRYSERLKTINAEFRTHHYSVIDVLEDEDALAAEQILLDDHDEAISLLTNRLQKIIKANIGTTGINGRDLLARKLHHIERALTSTHTEIEDLSEEIDTHLLRQYEDKLSEFRVELKNIHEDLLKLGLMDTDETFVTHTTLTGALFTCSHLVRKALGDPTSPHVPESSKGIKLPKLDVPTFDGNILNWSTFWEQFCVAVHDRSSISDPEKLVYLQQALKSGSAKQSIEGLSRSGDHYNEAVECLKGRYDRPRLIHCTHVQMIVDTPTLKNGSGRELQEFHDKIKQHLRALKAMGKEPPSPFITSVLELKLDPDTMFEWQKHSQESTDVPPCEELLEFVNLRAQASEVHSPRKPRNFHSERKVPSGKPVGSFLVNASSPSSNCVVCKKDKHPLYVCPKFKVYPHEQMLAVLKEHGMCMNCLRTGHFVKQCKSSHRCRKCQKPHHTLLHLERPEVHVADQSSSETLTPVSTSAASALSSDTLLMTCHVMMKAPDGSSVEARALLDSASSALFISERLAQTLCLPRSREGVNIPGVAGLTHQRHNQPTTHFTLSSAHSPRKKLEVTAIVVPKVARDLPFHPVSFSPKWTHLADLPLADPSFGRPGRIDLLLGVDISVQALLNGRRSGPSNAPVAFETIFRWVLAGDTGVNHTTTEVATFHVAHCSTDDLIRKFWETEESPTGKSSLSPEERFVVEHFQSTYSRDEEGRFIVPLPRRPDAQPLGESRSQAVQWYLALEKSLALKERTEMFNDAVDEYFKSGHAEPVPPDEQNKPLNEVFYLLMHIVYKESSSTTKARVVFDASAKSSTGVSLNDLLLVGPTVHPSLVDVLLRFRLYRVALIADVSRMYRAISLPTTDRDLHRFVWRKSPKEPLRDFRMTRVTFGVSSSSFAANMAVRQNALEHAIQYPLAAEAVRQSFYVDDCLSGADSISAAIEMQSQLQSLFSEGGFLLRKWNSSEKAVLEHIPPNLIDECSDRLLSDPQEYTKTLGILWNSNQDGFCLHVAELSKHELITKRSLVSDIGKTYDVLGWFSPTIIKAKILLQRVWETKINWDDPVRQPILDEWLQWRVELSLISSKNIPRCYYPKDARVKSFQLHGFSDASEQAYGGVVYLRTTDTHGHVHVSLICSKTKVAPIKRLTLPRLELCGADLLANLLFHVKEALNLPLQDVFTWTDSTIILNWLDGNPRRFKTYVGNRVSCIIELIPSPHWHHVSGTENPADSASRGLLPSELLNNDLWWHGPDWLKEASDGWPKLEGECSDPDPEECAEILCHASLVSPQTPILDVTRFSSFIKLKRVTAWCLRFINNCRKKADKQYSHLTTTELLSAENHWFSVVQQDHFIEEISLKGRQSRVRVLSCRFIHFSIPHDYYVLVGESKALNRLTQGDIQSLCMGNIPL